MFCSIECHDEILKKFKQNIKAIKTCLTDVDIKRKMSIIINESLKAFGSIDKMKETFQNATVNKTIFDFDCNGLSDEEMKKIVFRLQQFIAAQNHRLTDSKISGSHNPCTKY